MAEYSLSRKDLGESRILDVRSSGVPAGIGGAAPESSEQIQPITPSREPGVFEDGDVSVHLEGGSEQEKVIHAKIRFYCGSINTAIGSGSIDELISLTETLLCFIESPRSTGRGSFCTEPPGGTEEELGYFAEEYANWPPIYAKQAVSSLFGKDYGLRLLRLSPGEESESIELRFEDDGGWFLKGEATIDQWKRLLPLLKETRDFLLENCPRHPSGYGFSLPKDLVGP